MMICVYGAASNKIDSAYISAVEELGRKMALRGHSMVYGAGAEGLMGAAARGVSENGGKIIGIAPSFFNVDGQLFEECTVLIYTETMRERKKMMEDRAEAFIMVPGGIGTFDEFFEILTLKQLARHNKAIAIFNVNGYYDALEDMLQKSVDEGFLAPDCVNLYRIFDDADVLLDYIDSYQPHQLDVEKLRQQK